MYLWEDDIKNNLDLCKLLIKYYIENKGNINNYQSYNYFIDNNDILQLKENIIDPYFLRNETINMV